MSILDRIVHLRSFIHLCKNCNARMCVMPQKMVSYSRCIVFTKIIFTRWHPSAINMVGRTCPRGRTCPTLPYFYQKQLHNLAHRFYFRLIEDYTLQHTVPVSLLTSLDKALFSTTIYLFKTAPQIKYMTYMYARLSKQAKCE